MRLHLLALPGRPTLRSFSSCANTQKVRKLAAMMHSTGHEVYLYGPADNDAPCTEHVPCYPPLDEPEQTGNGTTPAWVAANALAALEIGRRKQPGDVICIANGLAQQPVLDAHPELAAVEFAVCYDGAFASWRVYESYAWLHCVTGAQFGLSNSPAARGRMFDAVIHPCFEVGDFPAGSGGDYLLFCGRVIDSKGIDTAIAVARQAGVLLIVAGEGEAIPNRATRRADRSVEYVGSVGPDERAELMGGARALIYPTRYFEPNGYAAIEAQLCGTPVISTDWGCFTETVAHGMSGFRCRTDAEFIRAVGEVGDLDRAAIRERALANFALEVGALKYDAYFEGLATPERHLRDVTYERLFDAPRGLATAA